MPIRLKRRTRDEPVERFRLREVEPEGHDLRDRLADWLEPQADYLAESRPALPEDLDDRAQDVWEPLLAIAESAVKNGRVGRVSRRLLSRREEREDDSLTVTLLRDIASFFSSKGHDRVRTADMLAYLHEVEESPWAEWRGKGLSSHGLSRLLKPYRIRTMPVWVDGETVKGYKAEQFEDAFSRVLGVRGVRTVRAESSSQKEPNPPNPYPMVGDEFFPVLLANAVRDGHIDEDEARQRYAIHQLVVEAERER